MGNLKRMLSAVLALVMVASLLPTPALAADTEPIVTETTAETEAVEITLETTAPEVFAEETAEAVGTEEIVVISTDSDVITSGKCGYNVKWDFDINTGTLTISGTGEISTWYGDWYHLEEKVRHVLISDGISVIPMSLFAYHVNLTDISIPDSVYSIDCSAFSDCSSLLQITIPEQVTSIGSETFQNCTSLTDIKLGNNIESIGYCAFEGCSSLTSITIPDSVTEMGYHTFIGCSGLSSVILSKNITAIPSYAFAGCSSLASIEIPENITSIGERAFRNCTSLKSVSIGNSVSSIGEGAFERCSSLTAIDIPDSVTCIEEAAFSSCSSLVDVTIPESVASIGGGAFGDCVSLTDIIIPDSVTSIGSSLFSGCSSLKEITLGHGITSIEDYMFSSCESLTSITIPDSVTSIGSYSFGWCNGLTGIVIPDGISSIGDYAFFYCENLTWVAIPASITSKGYLPFDLCKKLSDVYYSGTQEQWEAKNFHLAATIHFNSTGPDDVEDPVEELPPAYETETELTPGTAATPELNCLLDYLIDWKTAYDQWVDSVNEGLQDFGSTEEESKENIIRQEAERMREHDRNTHSRYLTGDMKGYESQAYHALASFFYDKISSTVPDLSSVDLSSDWAETNLTDMVVNSMRGGSKTYFYGKVFVSIEAISYMSLRFGSMTIRDENGNLIGPIIICSDTKEGRNALYQYMEELQDLGLNASFNIANAVYQDILGMSLTTLTSNFVNKAVLKIENRLAIKLDEKLGIAGVGKNLIKILDECYSFYTWAKKCIDSGKQEDVSSALINIANLKFEDTTVSKGVTKKAMKELQKANQKMQRAFREYLEGTIVEKEEGFWRWLFGCPVSICVYNSAGEQIGYVGEDDIWYTEDISITELGGVKEIVSFTEDALSFTVTATDHGTMSCMFERYDENFYPVGRLNYYNVILAPEQTFQVSVPETLAEKTETAVITSGGEAIYPDEYISSEDSAGVTISCSAVTEDGITGGTVSGTGTYIRGDCVILRAEAYEGFRFVGWMDGEYLVGTEEIYEFPAREDCQLAARFYKEKPIAIQLEADIGGTAIGESRYDSGETVTVIAIPARGYSFAGWYAGETLLSADAEYSFPASESLTLRAAFAQSEHPYDLGDVNHDTKINAKDATLILQKSVGVLKETAAFCEDCAEVSGDGKLNAKDSTLILQFSVGLRDSFPAGK